MEYNEIKITKYKFTRYGNFTVDNAKYLFYDETHYFKNAKEFKKIVSEVENLEKQNVGVKLEILWSNRHISDGFVIINSDTFTTDDMMNEYNALCNTHRDEDGFIPYNFISKKMCETLEKKSLPKYIKTWITKFYKLYFDYENFGNIEW